MPRTVWAAAVASLGGPAKRGGGGDGADVGPAAVAVRSPPPSLELPAAAKGPYSIKPSLDLALQADAGLLAPASADGGGAAVQLPAAAISWLSTKGRKQQGAGGDPAPRLDFGRDVERRGAAGSPAKGDGRGKGWEQVARRVQNVGGADVDPWSKIFDGRKVIDEPSG